MDHRKKTCEFAGLALPESYAIFAAGGYSGRTLDFQIDQSGHQATQMDVTVNYSSKPIVLMLGAYEPTIWNIKWTATHPHHCVVLVSGYHHQAIAGLDATVPVLNSSSADRGPCPCGYFYVGQRENSEKINQISRNLFGRPVDLVYPAKNGEVVIGDPVPAREKLITSESNSPESFHDTTAPIAGPAGLEDAVRKGFLRKATEADADAWVDALIANGPDRDVPLIAGKGQPQAPASPYMGCVCCTEAVLLTQQGSMVATWQTFSSRRECHSQKGILGTRLFTISTISRHTRRRLRNSGKIRKGYLRTKPEKVASFQAWRFPRITQYLLQEAITRRKLHFQIDQSGNQATQMDVTVNYSTKPVVIMLGAYGPTIWNIKWTAATRIAAVFVSGYHRQAVAGLRC